MNRRQPLVSILVPVYNVEDYLEQCLDSLISQTLQDIEIVCVNDGATDSSPAILRKYAKKDNRIKIVDKTNGGLPSARNAGLDVAIGKYVGFVDADDYVEKDMFERMYKEAIKRDADIVVCGAKCFPNGDGVPNWMKNTLSPDDIFFDDSSLDVFYTQRGARPFVWRDLVKHELIESHSLRLDESVVLGEDLAFQYKLYSHAKRVSFLSDKLYNYRWSRPGSIMETLNYKDEPTRLLKHLHMISSIYADRKQAFTEKELIRYFSWAVDFIYWDIVKITYYSRIEIAKRFCDEVISYGFYKYYNSYSDSVKYKFDYIHTLKNSSCEKPNVTLVVVLNGCVDYLANCLRSISAQTNNNVEILIYENGADKRSLDLMWEFFGKDARISLRLGGWQPLCYNYNDAISVAAGKYIMFMNGFEYFNNETFLADAEHILDSNGEFDMVCSMDGLLAERDVSDCQLLNYRIPLYRLDKIREADLKFEDYSFLTGSVFFTKYCLNSKKVFNVEQYLTPVSALHRNAIYAEEAKLLLRAMVWLLKTAQEKNLENLGYKITLMLNSENYARLITDSTYGFFVDVSSIDNPKEDFHKEVFELLAEANKYAFLKPNEPAILRALAMFIEKRHLFLEKM